MLVAISLIISGFYYIIFPLVSNLSAACVFIFQALCLVSESTLMTEYCTLLNIFCDAYGIDRQTWENMLL